MEHCWRREWIRECADIICDHRTRVYTFLLCLTGSLLDYAFTTLFLLPLGMRWHVPPDDQLWVPNQQACFHEGLILHIECNAF